MRNLPYSWTTLLTKRGFRRKKRRTSHSLSYGRKFRFETCEDRRMLATYVVNHPGDFVDSNPNVTTLREAINAANSNTNPDAITFASNMVGQTINITGSNLVITSRVTITGPAGGYVFLNDADPATTGLTFSGFDLSPTGLIGETAVSGILINGFDTGIKLQNLISSGFDFTLPFRIDSNQIQEVIDGIVLNNADVSFVFEQNNIFGTTNPNRPGYLEGYGIDIEDSGQFLPNGSSTVNPSAYTSFIGREYQKGNNIRGFSTGILIQRSFYPDLSISYNQIGSQSQPNTGVGISMVLRHPNAPSAITKNVGRIDHNSILYNGGDGIFTIFNDGTVIEENYIAANGTWGIRLSGGSDDFLIRRNTFDSNVADAIFLEMGAGIRNRITENDFYGVNVLAGAQAVDLAPNGHTPNDVNDLDYWNDPQLNELQNYADVGTITKSGDIWSVPITLSPFNSHDYVFEFYRYDPKTHTFRFIRSETKHVSPSYSETFFFVDGIELSDGERIGVVVIDDFGSNKGNTSELSFSSLSQSTPDTGGPRVVDVLLDGSTWANNPYSFRAIIAIGDQLRPIPTQDVNTIQIQFSEHIRKRSSAGVVSDVVSTIVDGNALLELKRTVRSPSGSITNESVAVTGFLYDPITHVATWTFPDLVDGKYAIHLKAAAVGVDGIVDVSDNRLNADWDNLVSGTPDSWQNHPNRSFTTGDAVAGTRGNEFRFHFALLAGDTDGDGYVDANNALPLREIGGADLNDDEVVDGLDLAIWQNGYGGTTVGDVNGDGYVDGRDFLLWQRAYGSKSAWSIDPPAVSAITVGLPPQVMNVIISGSLSVHDPHSFDTVDGSGAQLATVPVGLADTISIVFSENVNVSASSLIVVGMTTANVPEPADFSYDPLTFTATWRFEGWALGDNYLLHLSDSITDTEGNHLDGEWTNPASISTTNSLVSEFPSGDGESGGAFIFAMTLLPGDLNLDATVDNTDYDLYVASLTQGGGTLFIHGDFNGSGTVSNMDTGYFVANWLRNLQEPFLLADLDEDGDVDDDDLAILSDNYGLTGADWEDGDLNGDGLIDDLDLDLAFAQHGLRFANFVA